MKRLSKTVLPAGRVISSPAGGLVLAARDAALTHLLFAQERTAYELTPPTGREAEVIDRTELQLVEYFAGRRREFDLPLEPSGTEFQRAVWNALLIIRWGETASYAQLARRIGRPRAVRAVGAANGANPISIVIPCHRVIGADGSLTGYGGGLALKRKLLELEASEETSSTV